MYPLVFVNVSSDVCICNWNNLYLPCICNCVSQGTLYLNLEFCLFIHYLYRNRNRYVYMPLTVRALDGIWIDYFICVSICKLCAFLVFLCVYICVCICVAVVTAGRGKDRSQWQHRGQISDATLQVTALRAFQYILLHFRLHYIQDSICPFRYHYVTFHFRYLMPHYKSRRSAHFNTIHYISDCITFQFTWSFKYYCATLHNRYMVPHYKSRRSVHFNTLHFRLYYILDDINLFLNYYITFHFRYLMPHYKSQRSAHFNTFHFRLHHI